MLRQQLGQINAGIQNRDGTINLLQQQLAAIQTEKSTLEGRVSTLSSQQHSGKSRNQESARLKILEKQNKVLAEKLQAAMSNTSTDAHLQAYRDHNQQLQQRINDLERQIGGGGQDEERKQLQKMLSEKSLTRSS